MLSPMMQCAGRIRVKDCPFGAPDGTASNFQLVDRHGHPVTKDVRIQSIHQTDWQGRVELSDQPRTNLVPHSDDMAQQNLYQCTIGDTMTGPMGTDTLFEIIPTAPASGPQGVCLPTLGKTYRAFAVIANGADGAVSRLGLFNGGGSGWSGYFEFSWSSGVPAITSTVVDVTNATLTDAGSGIWIAQCDIHTAGTLNDPALIFMSDRNGVGTVFVGDMALMDAPGIYIPTTTSPVTVTDYTHDGQGGITTGQVPGATASLDWTGTARRTA